MGYGRGRREKKGRGEAHQAWRPKLLVKRSKPWRIWGNAADGSSQSQVPAQVVPLTWEPQMALGTEDLQSTDTSSLQKPQASAVRHLILYYRFWGSTRSNNSSSTNVSSIFKLLVKCIPAMRDLASTSVCIQNPRL